MGGKDEFTTPAKTADGQTIGNIRIHESGGEVHFHDDQNRVKAAVPVPAMYEVWAKLRDGRQTKFKHKDLANRATLRIKVVRSKKGPTDLQVSVTPMEDAVTPEFSSFDQFISGRNVGQA